MTLVRLPPLLAAVPLLGIARLLPAGDGFGLWLRLAAASLVLLLPGRLDLARARPARRRARARLVGRARRRGARDHVPAVAARST